MDTFNITPINPKIFIIFGDASSGKSFFANKIRNARVIDDLCTPNIYTRVESELGIFRKMAPWCILEPAMLIFITNDRITHNYIHQIIKDWLVANPDEWFSK